MVTDKPSKLPWWQRRLVWLIANLTCNALMITGLAFTLQGKGAHLLLGFGGAGTLVCLVMLARPNPAKETTKDA